MALQHLSVLALLALVTPFGLFGIAAPGGVFWYVKYQCIDPSSLTLDAHQTLALGKVHAKLRQLLSTVDC